MDEQGTRVTEIADIFPLQGQWREQDYFSLPDTTRIVELADGELIIPPPPDTAHQRAVRKLAFALERHIADTDLGEVFFSPYAVILSEGRIREPDVLFISRARAEIVSERGVEAAPDWVAEVLSPSTRRTDEVDKLAEYEDAGIPEYWLLDPEARTIRVYVLSEGRYGDPQTFAAGDHALSTAINGFTVPVEDIL